MVVEAAADAGQNRRRVLAHRRPFLAIAGRHDFGGLRKHAGVAAGEDRGDRLGQQALVQVRQRADAARARPADGRPGVAFELPDANRDVVDRRTGDDRLDAARLDRQVTDGAVAHVGPAVRQPRRVLGERLQMFAPAPSPEVARDGPSPQFYGLHAYAARAQILYLGNGSRPLFVDRYVTWIPMHFQILWFPFVVLTAGKASPRADRRGGLVPAPACRKRSPPSGAFRLHDTARGGIR